MINWFNLKLAQDKRSVCRQTILHTIILYESMNADCSVTVVRRNRDKTEAEVLYQRRTPELKDAPRLVLKQTPLLEKLRTQPTHRTPARLRPGIDRWYKNVPQAAVDNDQARKQMISSLTRLVVLEHP